MSSTVEEDSAELSDPGPTFL
eukprot:SAG31_NODE_40951_length_278_cov_0.865922_1_plen_20_part_10